jgi:hypothetical protein
MEVMLDSGLELSNCLEQATAKDLMLGPAKDRL